MLLFGHVPAWCHIGIRAHEDRQGFSDHRLLPLRVGLCDVTIKGSVLALSTVNDHRQRRRDRPPGRCSDELAKASSSHHCADRILIFFAEGGRDVHSFSKSSPSIDSFCRQISRFGSKQRKKIISTDQPWPPQIMAPECLVP